jgi:anthranilate synthase/aminodeoxychorismate synthase-like glutamine amidotransferase
MKPHVLLIDNLDSFTFNVVESFERLGAEVRVLRNSVPAADAVAAARARGSLVVLSPGPGHPADAGSMMEIIRLAKGSVELLGICLGHQGIVLEAGGEIERAPEPVHGKASLLDHDGAGPFAGLEGPIHAGRYHSLCSRRIPERFRVHAQVDGMAMAISDSRARQTGLQFHPESILTSGGDSILANVLAAAGREPDVGGVYT